MLHIINKAVLFIACTSIYLLEPANGLWIIPVIFTLTLSSLNSYFERPLLHTVSFIIYCVLCIFWSNLLLFLPLFLYDVITDKKRYVYILPFVPIVCNIQFLLQRNLVIILSFITLVILLKLRTLSTIKLKEDYIRFRDKASEVSMLLEEQNAELLKNQDHEINVATLTERNRIAREIHDNLGHILSRCLLQIGAMIAINKDSGSKEMLNSIKDTLSQAMDSVRKSVHNLHDESIDLHSQIHVLVKDFTFCPINLNYDISESPDKKLKYSFISIVKEALSNTIKHSTATEVYISLIEHPGFYQLIIQDNGKVENYNPENGIGIKNIFDRVAAFNGNVNIDIHNGFKIFISIPKENYK